MPNHLSDLEIEKAFKGTYISPSRLNIPDPFSKTGNSKPKSNPRERFFSQHPTDEDEALKHTYVPVGY